MKYTFSTENFDDWRSKCRQLLTHGVPPHEVNFIAKTAQALLFENSIFESMAQPIRPRVPPDFIELAETVSFHRDAARWNVLYETLWRLTHGEEHLLEITTDASVYHLRMLEKQVRRDCHKMKAFVRFRKMMQGEHEHYIAWHQPDHPIVRRVAPFFSRRFRGMLWSIFTPDESAFWDGSELQYGPGVARSEISSIDELEMLWKTYYAATFNPARIKIAMMKREMPVRFWPTLPEATLIDELLEQAPTRVNEMVSRTEGMQESASDYLPPSAQSLSELAAAADHCRGCDLCLNATQTVFGDGPQTAKLMIVGEQPGDEEDLEGKPFVGPSGRLLNSIFEELQIDRDTIYVTNAVKHFSFEMRGKIRLHKKPNARQVSACKPWLQEEIRIVKPRAILLLGATALQALRGRQVQLTKVRGQALDFEGTPHVASWHPAAILRVPVETATARREELTTDLRFVMSLANR